MLSLLLKHHLSIQLDEDTSVAILTKNQRFFLKEPIGTDFKANPNSLKLTKRFIIIS